MKREIENLKRKLDEAIEAHERDSPKVLKISKILDGYIVEDMKKQVYKKDLKF